MSGVKKYPAGEITINWEPAKCIHAGTCVKTLPHVYDPKGRPWIKPEGATAEELRKQIDLCPSGALSYSEENGTQEIKNSETMEVQIFENGPLMVKGELKIVKADGSVETKTKNTAFCRCGASNKKPFCDGSHVKAGFEGS